MNEPTWLTTRILLAVQEGLLSRFGGLSGIRDEGLLDSALHRPQQLYAYGNPTLFELAAAYAHGLVKNHPFLDGNKRIGYMSAYMFLERNGIPVDIPEEQVVLHTLALAAGEASEADYAVWLQTACECGNPQTL